MGYWRYNIRIYRLLLAIYSVFFLSSAATAGVVISQNIPLLLEYNDGTVERVLVKYQGHVISCRQSRF
jgi:hypothetical protein